MESICVASSDLQGLCGITPLGLSQTFLPKEILSQKEHFLRMALTELWAERGEDSMLSDHCMTKATQIQVLVLICSGGHLNACATSYPCPATHERNCSSLFHKSSVS